MRPGAQQWFDNYEANYADYQRAAAEVEDQITEALSGRALNVQLIESRAKSPESVAEKIERKSYGSPARQLDDLIGVRVITLFEHSIEGVVARLRTRFDVDEKRSANKTKDLKARQVGYRSSHLVVKVRRSGLGTVAKVLGKTFVEIQVRSVISHAWAEIEHSLRYKVGDGIPDDLSRRFDALAGTLELVDREFTSILQETVELVRQLSQEYSTGKRLDDQLSAVQLLAALESLRPFARKLGADNLPLQIEDAYRLARLLQEAGVKTVSDLASALVESEISRVVEQYSDLLGVDPEEASALAVLSTIIGIKHSPSFARTGGSKDELLRQALGFG